MPDLTIPILRFRNDADCARAVEVLREQQIDVRRESPTEISITPWDDREEAVHLLRAERIPCERGEMPVTRLGPARPQPIR